MSTPAVDPVLDALLRSAVEVTGATLGFLLRRDDEDLEVVAGAGPEATRALGGRLTADAGVAGYVVSSGQPLALRPQAGDQRLGQGPARFLDVEPTSALCVPCSADDAVLGAIELLDKAGGFTFDDVELVTLLAGIAGVALADRRAGNGAQVPSPTEIAGDLERLAAMEPARYTMVATIVEALLARG